jgi:Tol biopolymer transport system component
MDAMRFFKGSCVLVVACQVLATAAVAQLTQRVSVATDGTQADNDCGTFGFAFSAGGRYVAFVSHAYNLVPNSGTHDNVYLRDRQLGSTSLVTSGISGAQANDDSGYPGISSDGRFVVFQSNATNLIANGPTTHFVQVYLHDTSTGVTELVNVPNGGGFANQDSIYVKSVAVSDDGRFVAFGSSASNLVPGDTNSHSDVFVRDRQSGTTELVSVGPGGVQGDNNSGDLGLAMSADGRYVAFVSPSTNLVSGGTEGTFHVFVRDRQAGTTELVSVATSGVAGNDASFLPAISADGRRIAFRSGASNLVSNDTNGTYDVFVRDRQLGTTVRASVSSQGAQGDALSGFYDVAISADGRYTAFDSASTNFMMLGNNGWVHVFVHDLITGATEIMDVSSDGALADGPAYFTALSNDGRLAALVSRASNLVPGDTNGAFDVYVHDRDASGFTSLCDPGTAGVIACPCANPPSGPGRGCDNSSATGGASLTASGFAYLTSDTLLFHTSGEKPTATSILMQGSSLVASGVVFGQGVRCAGGALKRLYTTNASAGSIAVPQAGDPSVSARSAALGDVIQAGESRWYLVYYRDPIVLGGCPASSTFNATQTGQIAWSL